MSDHPANSKISSNPMISIITPSLNCGAYIEQCIQSVLSQNYPDFEHIIIDGGSQDGTVEILKKYSHLRWISEPDQGEADALNKALKMAKGGIIGWLNADDYYLEGVFHTVSREIDPRCARHIVYGATQIIDDQGRRIRTKRKCPEVSLQFLLRWWKPTQPPHQPSIFYSRELVRKVGPFNTSLHFSIDLEYWLRIVMNGYSFTPVDQVFSCARMIRPHCKSRGTNRVQLKSRWEVTLPYHKFLSFGKRIAFWLDYVWSYPLVRLCSALGVRRRFRDLRFRWDSNWLKRLWIHEVSSTQ
ncbi:MAG: glycosyltransferase [Chlamydiae bacterium]|nr:glycosyltransferase [Chlamydiota bacterium]